MFRNIPNVRLANMSINGGHREYDKCKNGYNNFKCQLNYYDRIIRNEKELFNIRKYILNNPLKWDLDNNNPVNWDKTNIKLL